MNEPWRGQFKTAKVGDKAFSLKYGEVEIIKLLWDNSFPIVGRVLNGGFTENWTIDGFHAFMHQYPDLWWTNIIPDVPPQRPKKMVKKVVQGWANVYLNGDGTMEEAVVWPSKEKAEQVGGELRHGKRSWPAPLEFEVEE